MFNIKKSPIILIFCFNCAYSFLPGTITKEKEIKVGMFLTHFSMRYSGISPFVYDSFRTAISFTMKGLEIGYFNNSHKQNSFYFQIKRNIFRREFKKINLIGGYGAGLVGGYCAFREKNNGRFHVYRPCQAKQQWLLHPAGELFLKAKKDNFSLNISYSVMVLIGTASFYFD